MSAMLSFNIFVIIWGLLVGFGEAVCSGHSDCVTLATATSDRKYCCGGTFCCTLQQFTSGVTEDPFTSMSIPGIVGIVAGIVVFLAICGVLIYFLLKGARKGSLNRRPRSSRFKSPSTSELRLERSKPLPGHAVPTIKKSPDYDYPPDSYDDPEYPKYHKQPQTTSRKSHIIPTVIGTNDPPPKYDKKYQPSRYAYDGPAAYDSDEGEDRYYSRKKDYYPDHGHRSKDPYRKDEYSNGRRYHEDKYPDDRRYRDEHSHDRRYDRDNYPEERRYHRDEYSHERGYHRDEYSHERRYHRDDHSYGRKNHRNEHSHDRRNHTYDRR